MIVKWIIGSALLFGINVMAAQFIVWGLALDHISSGIWGPYFLVCAASIVITGAVANGRPSGSN